LSFRITPLLLGALVALGCGEDPPQPLEWRVRFADPADAVDVRAFSARILEGGCAGEVVFEVQFPRTGPSADVPLPPTLGPGPHGFAVTARDAACRVVGFECEGADLPDPDGVVEVVLFGVAGRAECAVSLCADGICTETDGGVSSCDPGFEDCNLDPTDGCETDVETDLEHCGACGSPCRTPHATPLCDRGVCRLTECEPSWSDCDADPMNGCETSILTLSDCGRCRVAGEAPLCALPHATATCGSGSCELIDCHEGWGDCDGAPANGCETPLDTGTDCGACGTTCDSATPNCVFDAGGGTCVAACPGTAPTLCGTSCVEPMTDPRHCGGCRGEACLLDHGAASCVAGACALASCDPEWADCNGDAVDGCETATTTLSNCGGCGVRCDADDAILSCEDGVCDIDRCFSLRDDCNDDASDGCEADLRSATTCGSCATGCTAPTNLCSVSDGTPACVSSCADPQVACGDRCLDTRFDMANCGGCGTACALPDASERCFYGSCEIVACDDGRADCDRNSANGCEAMLNSDRSNCGSCGVVCRSDAVSCSGGVCSGCDTGRGDCNGDPDDGCETPLDTPADCGACGRGCDLANATSACVAGSCAVEACAAGFADCDGLANNGCEVDINRDSDHCGGCRMAGGSHCVGMERQCCAGTCMQTCP
jgi:hypothetical protein